MMKRDFMTVVRRGCWLWCRGLALRLSFHIQTLHLIGTGSDERSQSRRVDSYTWTLREAERCHAG
jgi:hypothetical protein